MNAWSVPGYREERELGSGASGRVVLATYVENGGHAAIKYLSDELSSDPRFRIAFREEARRMAEIEDPNIARCYGYVESPLGSAVVMEFVDGVSLREILHERGVLSPEGALVVLKGSLLGLSAAHGAGILHRDYKPENVLVQADGFSKLTDFGVAAVDGDPGMPVGTPPYMAPEQWNGALATPATDMYAATCVFFECLTGRTPYSADHVAAFRHLHQSAAIPVDAVPRWVRDLVARGLAKSPADRPSTARAFIDELETAAFGAYGPDWEHRGRRDLAEPAAHLDPGLPPAEQAPRTSTGFALATPNRPRRYGPPVLIVVGVLALGAVAAVLANRDDTPTSQISADQATQKATPTAFAKPTTMPGRKPKATPRPTATSAAALKLTDLGIAGFDGSTATVRARTSTPQNLTLVARFAEGPSPSRLAVSGTKTFVLTGSTSYHRAIEGGFVAPSCGETVYRQVMVSTTTPTGRARSKVVSVKGDPCPAPSVENTAVDWDGHAARITVRTDGPGVVRLAAEFTRREGEGPAKVVDRASRTLSGDTAYRFSLPGDPGEVGCGETAYFGVKVTTDPSAANGPQTKEVRLSGPKCAPPTVSITSWDGSTLSVRVGNASPDPVTLTAAFRQTVTVRERTVKRSFTRQAELSGDSGYDREFSVRFTTPQCGYMDVRKVVVNVSSALGAASDSARTVQKGDACAEPAPKPTREGPHGKPTREGPHGKPTRGPVGEPGERPSARSDDKPTARPTTNPGAKPSVKSGEELG